MIALTTQPTSDGYYSAYLKIRFVATDTGAANKLTFTIKNSDGTSIDGMPSYQAPRINSEYKFDASVFLKSLFDVRTTQGMSTTTIEDLTDLYGKYEVEVTDGTSTITSNEFFAFAFLDNKRYLNDQTAYASIAYKQFLYSGNYKNETYPLSVPTANLPDKTITPYNRVVLWVTGDAKLRVTTNFIQTLEIDLTSYANKLISVPMTKSFIQSNFSVSGGGFMLNFSVWNLRDSLNKRKCFFKLNTDCNKETFVYINRYGAKETLVLNSKRTESLNVNAEEFRNSDFIETGNDNYFNTSSATKKYNTDSETGITIRSQYLPKEYKELLIDFVKSPICWVEVNNELREIVVPKGNYKLEDKGRSVSFNFRYKFAQTELNFV